MMDGKATFMPAFNEFSMTNTDWKDQRRWLVRHTFVIALYYVFFTFIIVVVPQLVMDKLGFKFISDRWYVATWTQTTYAYSWADIRQELPLLLLEGAFFSGLAGLMMLIRGFIQLKRVRRIYFQQHHAE